MRQVWIVFDDEVDMDILGVFDNLGDAVSYAEEVSHLVEHGVKYSEYTVPWRLTDRSTKIEI